MDLTKKERAQIGTILRRRANEVASFSYSYREQKEHLGAVELALSREIDRLRSLAEKVDPQDLEEE